MSTNDDAYTDKRVHMQTTKPRISPKEIKKATVACRRELKQGQDYIDIGNDQKAYAAFGRAQDYAFQAKDMAINGGSFEPFSEIWDIEAFTTAQNPCELCRGSGNDENSNDDCARCDGNGIEPSS